MAIDLKLLDKYSSITSVTAYKTLSLANWDKAVLYRGLQTKTYAELLELKKYYPVAIEEQKLKLAETKDEVDIANITNKLKRLVDKYACTLKEIDIRDRNLIVRVI